MKTWSAGQEITATALNTTMWSWASWSPGIAALDVDDGALSGRYLKLGTWVQLRFKAYFGASPSISGDVQITLPHTAYEWSGHTYGGTVIGTWAYGAANLSTAYTGAIVLDADTGATASLLGAWDATSPKNWVGATYPMSVGAGYTLSGVMSYESTS